MKKIFPLFASIILLLSACGNAAKDEHHSEEHANEHADQSLENDSSTTHNHLSGDLQETTDSVKQLPSFLDSQPEDIRLVYEVAGQATDILEWIPCYCGCGESAGHRNNLNCFIAEKRDDGSVVWDDHGTRCQVCLEIAVESVQMYQQGKSLKEIRQAIDAKYEEGYATPTPTNMPA
ncbi:PCYCGC domain-containing protein [Ureibacillus sp. Re31]|uniref:PCYCGC domain-containing protein n=1 Tax=Ureibacillus galli TaxID=2762222 RepID=A0ABR8XAH6_9BACL|nr:PCYCGC domain-containing protein [Ureibacillus galli]MBD8025791.1 PCYCGC domain-containing protein [Ureibacillus galli]